MHVISYDQAIAAGISSASLLRCAEWNADRADYPMGMDTFDDCERFRMQAEALTRVAAHVEHHEMATPAT